MFNYPFFNSIQKKILYSTVSVFIFFLFAGSIILYLLIKQEMESRITVQINEFADSLVSQVENTLKISASHYFEGVLQGKKEYLNLLANNGEKDDVLIDAALKPPADDIFLSIWSSSDGAIAGYSPDNRLKCSSMVGGFSEYNHMGELFLSSSFIFTSKKWCVMVSAPESAFKDIFKNDNVRQSILSRKYGKTGYSFIIDSAGNVIIHPALENENIFDSKDAGGRYFIREMIDKKSGITTYPWKNPGETAPREKVSAHRYIQSLGWIAASSSYYDEIYAPLEKFRIYFASMIIAAVLIILPVTKLLSSSISKPIKKLAETLKNSEGRLDISLEKISNDETGTLVDYFRTYIDAIKTYHIKLEKDISEKMNTEKSLKQALETERVISDIATGFITSAAENTDEIFRGSLIKFCLVSGAAKGSILSRMNRTDFSVLYSYSSTVRDGDFHVHTTEFHNFTAWLTDKLKYSHEFVMKDSGRINTDITMYLKSRRTEALIAVMMGIETESDTILLFEYNEPLDTSQSAFIAAPLNIYRYLITNALKRIMWEESIQNAYDLMEKNVQERTAELSEKTKQLEEFNRNLEERVKEETEKLRTQEQLLVQQSKMAAMGEMIGSIAHQWRQPLNALALLVQDIEEAHVYDDASPEYIHKTVAEAMRQINHMSVTIDDFRNFFKPSKTQEKIDITLAVIEVLTLMSSQILNKGIDISFTMRSEDKTEMEITDISDFMDKGMLHRLDKGTAFTNGYPNEFKHVLMNIINNAKDELTARREKLGGGTESKIWIDVNSSHGLIRISIKDSGAGINPEIIDKIFDPYFTTKDAKRGTGMGLYMSKVIIENNMNGHLNAANTDKGAEFVIELKEIS
jgi:signal transduction histidine kinase